MRWKTTVLLLVVTVGVGAYVSLYELKQPTPDERERRSHEVLALAPASVTRLELAMPQAAVTLTREGATWRLAPVQLRADPDQVERLLRGVNPLMAERVLTASAEQPLDLSVFGLAPPIGRLTVHAGGEATVLLLGETTAVNDNRYLQVAGRPEVFVVPPALFDDANQPAEAFRDPLLVRIESWSVEVLTVAAPEATLSLARTDNAWSLTQPLPDRADRAEVNALLRQLGGIRIRRFLDDRPQVEGVASWGFDRPALEVALLRGPGPPTTTAGAGEPPTMTTLVFGAPLPDDASLVYAKRSDELPLYAVAAADLEPLRRDPHGLRERACFEFFADLVSRVEVMREGAGWTVERADGRWWRLAESGEELDAARVEEWLGRLAELRLGGFEDDTPTDLARYGLPGPPTTTAGAGEPPFGVITVWTTDREEPQRLLIGSAVADSASRYGRIEGRAAVVRFPESVVELLAPLADVAAGPEGALQDGEMSQEGQ